MRIGINAIHRMIVLACLTISIGAHAQAPGSDSAPFAPHIRNAIVDALDDEGRRFEPLPDAAMIRYDAQGKLDVFHCPHAMGLKIDERDGEIRGLVIAECPRDAYFDKNFGRDQLKNFAHALDLAALSQDDLSAHLRAGQAVSVEEQGATYIHVRQYLLSGVGGSGGHGMAAIESMLILPNGGKNALLIQSHMQGEACSAIEHTARCDNFRKSLREIGRHVQAALLLPKPAAEAYPARLRAGEITRCDSVVGEVRHALRQSIDRKRPVTETPVYKKAFNPDIKNGMLAAAKELADGTPLNDAARNVGLVCLSKPFTF